MNQVMIIEKLEYAMIEKFSCRWKDIHELRKLISKQCALKGKCKIELLCNRYILIKVSLMEDYVHLLSKLAFYITQRNNSYPMKTFKWELLFDPMEETSSVIAWISLLELLPNIFGKEAIFSLAKAVGKPLQVDMATKN